MKVLKILFRNIFGWKTSDLIEHMINTGRWGYFSYMCVAISSYLPWHLRLIDMHTSKIGKRIGGYGTLTAYLMIKNHEIYPTRQDKLTFWLNYIEELRAKGE